MTTKKATKLRETLRDYGIRPDDMRDYLQLTLQFKPSCKDCDERRYSLLKIEAERIVTLLRDF